MFFNIKAFICRKNDWLYSRIVLLLFQILNAMNELEEIRTKIYEIRGVQVMLDRDLAELYGVETGALNRAVKRNIERFPCDFMFQLNKEEHSILKCQFGISSWGGARTLPFAFTEQGVAMLSGVLRSTTAIQVNIRIMRAFVAVRQYLSMQKRDNDALEARIKKLEETFEESLRDRNEIDEDTRFRLDQIELALAEMRSDFKLLAKSGNPGRTEVKGFKRLE